MRVFRFWLLLMTFSSAAHADDGFYPLMADDGTTIANHRVDVSIEAEIEKLPGVVIAGNPRGSVTLPSTGRHYPCSRLSDAAPRPGSPSCCSDCWF